MNGNNLYCCGKYPLKNSNEICPKFEENEYEVNYDKPVSTEVIPVWYIKKWKKENAEPSSSLDFFIEQLIKDWHIEEIRQANN